MAIKTRPYVIERQGVLSVVDAPNPGAALAHVTRDLITRCEAASGKFIADYVRSGGVIQTAGAVPTEGREVAGVERTTEVDDIDQVLPEALIERDGAPRYEPACVHGYFDRVEGVVVETDAPWAAMPRHYVYLGAQFESFGPWNTDGITRWAADTDTAEPKDQAASD